MTATFEKRTFQVTGGTVTLNLPKKSDRGGNADVEALRTALESVTAFHPCALTRFTYYEVVDSWLGPWGQNGYPLGYGRYYAILFSTNPRLRGDVVTNKWVEETLVRLQEALTDFILERFRGGTLGSLTEGEFRRAAFASHSKAYTDGGLAKVAMIDPIMILFIVAIPGKEFRPTSRDFKATVRQVIETALRTAATGGEVGLAALMPAHSGFLRRAAEEDWRNYREAMTLPQRLSGIRSGILSGRFDYLPWLNQLIASLERERFDSLDAARAARELIELAELRRLQVAKQYETLLKGAPPEVSGTVRKAMAPGKE